MVSVLVRAKRLMRIISRIFSRVLFGTPPILFALVIVLAGMASLFEPAWSLRFRRGVGLWKVVPYLCGSAWFQSMADSAYNVGNVPTVAVILIFTKLLMMWFLFPFVAFMSAVSKPDVVRSVIILVGLPSVLLSLCCRVRAISKLPGLKHLMTWIFVALLCGVGYRYPAILLWAASSISIPIYLSLLAAALTLAAVQERLEEKKQGKKQCREHVVYCTVYLLAGVMGMWIIQASDSRLAAFNVLRDVNRLVTFRQHRPE